MSNLVFRLFNRRNICNHKSQVQNSSDSAPCILTLLYNKCTPFLQLLLNLKRPIPPTLPNLMQGSWLCGLENVAGFNLPKICCPNDAIVVEPTPSTTTTTTTTTTPAVTFEPEM